MIPDDLDDDDLELDGPDSDGPDSDGGPEPGAGRLRLDKWLWYARFLKTRSLAAKLCTAGKIRVAGTVVTKANHGVRPGDVLTFPQGRHIRVIKVKALGTRRGPAPEAQTLYEDLAPPTPDTALPPAADSPGRRPTKSERRELLKLKGGE